MSNLMNDQELQELLDGDVLELIGGKDLPQEKKQELYLEIANTVQNRAIAQIYTLLAEDEVKELDQLLDGDDTDKVQDYLREKALDLPQLLTQEAIAYKLEIYELFKMAKNQKSADVNNAPQSV